MKKTLLNICYTYAFKVAFTASLASLLFVSVPSSECWGEDEVGKFTTGKESKIVRIGELYKELKARTQYERELGKGQYKPEQVQEKFKYRAEIFNFFSKMKKAEFQNFWELWIMPGTIGQDVRDGFNDYYKRPLVDQLAANTLFQARLTELNKGKPLNNKLNAQLFWASLTEEERKEYWPEDVRKKSWPEANAGSEENTQSSDPQQQQSADPASSAGAGQGSATSAEPVSAALNIQYEVTPQYSVEIVGSNDVDFSDVWKNPMPQKIVTIQTKTNAPQTTKLFVSSAGLSGPNNANIPFFVTVNSKETKLSSQKAELLSAGSVQDDVGVSMTLTLDNKTGGKLGTFPVGKYSGTIVLEVSEK